MGATAINVPNISQEDLADLAAFHAAHFSTISVDHFSTNFLGPVEEEYLEEVEEDDGLGYYDDGVKRTLTDPQIAIFRHSEIQTLLRERRHAEEAKEAKELSPAEQDSTPIVEPREFEEGELRDESILKSASASSRGNEQSLNRKARKAQQAKQKGFFKQKMQPDLRKRTWDKVDTGMESLDYDGQSGSAPASNTVSQRRRISYDD